MNTTSKTIDDAPTKSPASNIETTTVDVGVVEGATGDNNPPEHVETTKGGYKKKLAKKKHEQRRLRRLRRRKNKAGTAVHIDQVIDDVPLEDVNDDEFAFPNSDEKEELDVDGEDSIKVGSAENAENNKKADKLKDTEEKAIFDAKANKKFDNVDDNTPVKVSNIKVVENINKRKELTLKVAI